MKDWNAFVRIRSVLLKDQGGSSEKIAEALPIHQTTVDGYGRESQEKQKLFSEHKGSQLKLWEQQIERLGKYITEIVIYNKFYEKFSFSKQAIEEFLTVTYPAVKESLIARITDNFPIPSQAKSSVNGI